MHRTITAAGNAEGELFRESVLRDAHNALGADCELSPTPPLLARQHTHIAICTHARDHACTATPERPEWHLQQVRAAAAAAGGAGAPG